MGNEAACDELRKYFSWATQVLAFFFFFLQESFCIYIQRGAIVNCKKNNFPVGKKYFSSWADSFSQLVGAFLTIIA